MSKINGRMLVGRESLMAVKIKWLSGVDVRQKLMVLKFNILGRSRVCKGLWSTKSPPRRSDDKQSVMVDRW